MKKLFKKIRKTTRFAIVISTLIMTVLVFGGLGLSWLITCGIVKLITLCFDWTYYWPVATGIWLVLCLVSTFVSGIRGSGGKND